MYGADTYNAADINNRATALKITSTTLYVPITTLASKDSANLTKQLSEGFKRSVCCSEYKSKIESRNLDNDNPTRFYLVASFQGVKKLFVVAFNDTTVNVARNPVNDTKNIEFKELLIESIFFQE